jgi:hypothetical protein
MPDRVQQPRLATVLLSLFSTEPDFPEIEGYLSEEFHDRVNTAGPTAAQRWYLREALRNVSTLTLRQFARSPVQTLAISIACLLALNLPPFLILFQIHHRRLPNLEWSTFIYMSIAYQVFIPPLLGFLTGRFVRGLAVAIALVFTALYALAASPRLYVDFLFDPLVPHPLSWQWLWAVVGFSAASLPIWNQRHISSQPAD